MSKLYFVACSAADPPNANSSNGTPIQVILYAPPKLHRHNFWALDPLRLDETPETSPEDAVSQETGNALQSERVDQLHELAQTFSPASASTSLRFEELLGVVRFSSRSFALVHLVDEGLAGE